MRRLLLPYILFFPFTLLAQHYYFKRYTTWDGLIQNTIRSLKQDDIGRLWIGTAEGFSIYNGKEFSNYTKKNGLGGNVVECFYKKDSSTMWVGTADYGISVVHKPELQKDTVIRIIKGKKYFINNTIDKIFRDSKDRIWICTEGGLTMWSNSDPDNCKITNFDKKGEPGRKMFFTAAEDEHGTLWFGTEKGLVRYSHDRFKWIKGYSSSIWAIRPLGKDSLWLATARGVLIYSGGKLINPFKNSLLSTGEVGDIYRDKNSIIWIASQEGLFRYDGRELKDFSISKGSGSKFILCILEGMQGNTWIGTVDGLNEIFSKNLYYYNARNKYGYLWRIIPRPDGEVYAATKDGLYKLINGRLKLSHYNKLLPTKAVTNVIFRNNGVKYFSTDKGIFKVKRGKVVKSFTKKDGFDSNYILTMTDGGKDSIWVGTKGYWKTHLGRVYLIRHDSVINIPALTSLPPDPVTMLYLDKDRNLWIGFFAKGLYRLSGDKITAFGPRQGLKDRYIRNVLQDKKGNIWVMTRFKGLFKYNGKTFKEYDVNNGLITNWILTGVQDNYGTLWFNTAKGVCSFDGKNFERLNYGGNLMSGEMWASSVDPKGNLWFGNMNYLFFYKPGRPVKRPVSKIYISDFKVGKGNIPKLSSARPIVLSYANNSVEIEYNDVDFKNGESPEYEYKLSGLHNGWYPPTKRNYVMFNHLPAGSYKFYVKSKLPGGEWGGINSDISFIIDAPVWQRTWFIVLAALAWIALISLLTALIYQYRIRHLLKIQEIRSRIASDLHDDIGANLSSISIFSELAKINVNNEPKKAAQIIGRIGSIARELADSMSDIVWVINPETESMGAMVKKMRDFAFELLQARQIRLSFFAADDLPEIKLDMETRRNLLLIFKEAVNNTAKYSKATAVIIEIKVVKSQGGSSNKSIYMKIEDNGIGFGSDCDGNGNGLSNMRKRAEQINAELSIRSEKSMGTAVVLRLPSAKK